MGETGNLRSPSLMVSECLMSPIPQNKQYERYSSRSSWSDPEEVEQIEVFPIKKEKKVSFWNMPEKEEAKEEAEGKKVMIEELDILSEDMGSLY